MVSAVDFLPTLLDIAQLAHPAGLDGRSFLPLLRGESQDERDLVIKEYNENAGASRDPMRAVQSRRYLYLFNPWSNGRRVMATATSGTSTYRRMVQLAETSPALARRLDLYRHRVVEEFYDVQTDPDCLQNLVDDPDYATVIDEHRRALEAWMQRTGDDLLDVFRHRDDAALREQYVQRMEKEAEARRQSRRQQTPQSNPRQNPRQPEQRRDLISLEVPDAVQAGQQAPVAVKYRLPESIGKQMLVVTLKAGRENRRVERQMISVSGTGQAELAFAVPDRVPDNVVRVAAFVGADYESNLQHLQSEPIPVTSD